MNTIHASRRYITGLILMCLSAMLVASDDPVEQAAVAAPTGGARKSATFEDVVEPFIDKYCVSCHGATLHRGDIDLTNLSGKEMAKQAELWRLIEEQVSHRIMPPPEKDQPEEAERLAIAAWIHSELNASFAQMPQRGGPALTRRLTAAEFDRTTRDLTGIDKHFSKYFPTDGGGGEGFSNNASTLFVSALLMDKIMEVSREVVENATVCWAKGISFDTPEGQKNDDISFADLRTKILTDRGVLADDAASIAIYLEHVWLYGQERRKDPSLKPEDYAVEQKLQPAFLARLYEFVRSGRPPRGAADGMRELFKSWGQTRRISPLEPFDEQLVKVREIAAQCKDVIVNHAGDMQPYFGDKAYKQKVIEEDKEQVLEKLVFYLPDEALLASLEGEARQRFEGLWMKSRLENGDSEAENEASKFAGQMLADFASRAWRRPVTDRERVDFILQYRDQVRDKKTFEQVMRTGIRSILVSPNYLFRVEYRPVSGEEADVEPYEMASRLSYFLWGTMPDAELMDLAGQDKLQDPEVLKQQVQRMLRDHKAEALAQSFFGEWIGYEDLLLAEGPDTTSFPGWSADIAEAMVEQSRMLFAEMVRDNRPYTDLVSTDEFYINNELARFLNISGSYGDRMERIDAKSQERFGVLGLPAVHVLTSNPHRTSPVRRGDWVMAVLLGTPTPPPPANVGEIDEAKASTPQTLREQMVAHRENAACASCHNRIDPLGFPLERFDAVGRYRAGELDLAGQLPDGTTFDGPKGLRDVILARDEQLRRQLVVKGLGYALGREIKLEDEPVVRHISAALKKDNRLSVLFTEIVLSPAFRRKQ